MGQVKSFNMCLLQLVYATIEDIKDMFVMRFIVTAYQHDDDEFVSKCN